MSAPICLASLPVRDNRLSDVLLAFCQCIAFVFHVALIMFLVLLVCWKVFDHISGPRRLFPIKTIQIIIFQVCLPKLRIADMEFLMPAQWQCPHYRKLPIIGDLVGKNMILGMSEVFAKELDVVAAKWDPKPYRWLRQNCVSKPWQ